MLPVLAAADAFAWLTIGIKTVASGATLVAAGSVFAWLTLPALGPGGRAALARIATCAALVAAVFSALRLPVQASFLMGGTLEGAVDTVLLGMVAQGPLGISVVGRLAGLALIPALLLPRRGAAWIALAGALVACASFAFRGHALGDPRPALGILVTLHIVGLAFWLGAMAPLLRAARHADPASAGALAHDFGRLALWVVAALVVAGGGTLILLGAATPRALVTPYGQLFVLKMGLFAGVMALAALNKLHLTPALRAGDPGAARRLRRSVGVEIALIACILTVTATLTTLTAPPSGPTHAAGPRPGTSVTGDVPWRA